MRAGDLLLVTRDASVQFVRPIRFRVIRVLDLPTYPGWIWLDGYQLDGRDQAVARRSIYVQRAGLRKADTARRGRAPTGTARRRPH